MRELIVEYVPQRIATSDEAEVLAKIERSEQLLKDDRAIAEEVAYLQPIGRHRPLHRIAQ